MYKDGAQREQGRDIETQDEENERTQNLEGNVDI